MIATLRHRTGDEIQDRYLVLDELGAGAFGTVYRCRDRELGLTVAVKELHVLDDPATAPDERALALEQFRREAIHLSELRHAHIVSGHYQPHTGTWLVCPTCGVAFRGVATCPEHNARPVVLKQRYYLVMEYVGGPDLESAMAQTGGILRTEVAVRVASQVADALAHIHERGWVHRDIKPENIRLRAIATNSPAARGAGLASGLNAVLLDFGIATESGAEGQFSTRPQKKTTGGGTWGYAPDDPRERLHPDARSDIHALGMTMYHVLCGRDPTEAANLIEMRNSRPSAFNPRVPPALDDLILGCIAPEAAARPSSAREVAAILAQIESPSTSSAPSSTSGVPVSAAGAAPPSTSPSALAVPFTFASGQTASNLTQLVKLCEARPDEACEYLFHGDISNWLRATGRESEAARVEEIRAQYVDQKRQGLEAFIQFTGVLPPPTLKVTPESLDFGTLWMGQKRAVDLHIENPGRGYLFGMVRTRYSNLSFPATFDGNSNVLSVVLDSRGLARGTYEGDVEIDSSGGEVRLPFRFTVFRRRSAVPFWHVFGASVCGGLSAMMARTLPFSSSSDPKVQAHLGRWLSSGAQFGDLSDKASLGLLFAVCVWITLAVLFAFEGVRRKSCSLFLSGALSSAILGAACFGGATLILPAVDGALRPALQPLVHNWPAGAWMLAGGLAGAIYGTASRWKDLLTTRVAHIFGGWVAAIVVLFALLAAVLMSMGQSGSVG